ncbi:MAG: fucose isomerase [Bacillota bacterium]
MKTQLNVGFITTVSGRWPRETSIARRAKYEEYLKTTYPQYNIVGFDNYIDNNDDLYKAVETFKANDVDVIVYLYGSFSGDDFGTILSEEMNHTPIILWALQEPELGGGRLLSNALVSATMNSASIKRLGGVCYFVFGDETDARVEKELTDIFMSYNIAKNMKRTFLGLLGYRPTAFYNCAFDEGLIRRVFGVRMEETDLKIIFDKMEKYSDAEIAAEIATITTEIDKNLPEGYIENHARLIMAVREVFEETGYDYATLKCWPEMGALKTTPCAVIGRLADEGKHIMCEGDVDAGLAYMVENIITNQPSFVTDMININEEANTFTFWHCGNAAPSLVCPSCKPVMGDHPLAGQGTALRATLKEGAVTFARFCNIGGVYKLFIASGEAVKTDMYTPGSMVNVKIKTPVREAIYKITDNEVPHHYSVVWADVASEMKAYAKLLGMEIIEI